MKLSAAIVIAAALIAGAMLNSCRLGSIDHDPAEHRHRGFGLPQQRHQPCGGNDVDLYCRNPGTAHS